MTGGQACDKMIFECTYGSFCGVSAMNMWRNQLEIDIFGAEELSNRLGAFIVHDMEVSRAAM
jgi:hypothetical protein